MHTRAIVITLGTAVVVALVAAAIGLAHGGDATSVHSCVTKQGSIQIVGPNDECKSGQTALDWGIQGPQGVAGPSGPPGPAGPPDPGVAAFVDRFGSPAGAATSTETFMGECLLGAMILTASQFLPKNYMPADGRLLPINQWQALFSLLEFRYGGDGQVRFALPDLRAVAPDHMTYGICTVGIYPELP